MLPRLSPGVAWRGQFVLLNGIPCVRCAGDTKRAFPETYRDVWPEAELLAEAAAEARRLGAPVDIQNQVANTAVV